MIILSAFVPPGKEYVLRSILGHIQITHPNDRVYIGVQQLSVNIQPIIDEFNLSIKWDYINSSTYVSSDVPGFQKALEIYLNNDYFNLNPKEVVYFIHTKGVTTGNDNFRDYLMYNLLYEKSKIEYELAQLKTGCYGYYLSPIYQPDDKPYTDVLRKWNNSLPYPVLNYFFVYTFYSVRKEILDSFLSSLDRTFFTDNLQDVYFFERDFIHFCDMQGYLPAYSELVGNNGYPVVTNQDFSRIKEKWNKLK